MNRLEKRQLRPHWLQRRKRMLMEGEEVAPFTTGPATDISVVPSGNISSTNVQSALMELDAEKVAKAGDTMTGNLTVARNQPAVELRATTLSDRILGGTNAGGLFRWLLKLGNSASESGSNAGSNLVIERYNDAGTLINAPITVSRATGVVDFAATPTVVGVPISAGGGGVSQAYVDAENDAQDAIINAKADTSAVNSADALRLLKGGDTMSGYLNLVGPPSIDLHAATKKYVDDSVAAVSGTGAAVHVGDTPPVSPVLGQLWWESDTGYMFIWFVNGGIPQWVPVVTTPIVPALFTPALNLVTDPEDRTPEFTLTGDLTEGDTVRLQIATVTDFSSGSSLTNTIDTAENLASSISFTTGPLPDGTWYFRGRIERANYPPSGWSNIESITFTPSIIPEVSQFLDRTTGLDSLYVNAYTDLIEGLVAAGIWSKLDALYIFATKDVVTAKLNIKSSSYTATGVGPPTFVTNKGFRMHPSPAMIDTNLNAYPGDKLYKQDSAHMGVWTYADEGYAYGGLVGTTSPEYYPRQYILPNYGLSGIAYFRINTNGGIQGPVGSVAGWTLANRSDANNVQGYWNITQIATSAADGSVTLKNNNFSFTDQAVGDENAWISGGSLGGSLTSTEAIAYYNHLRTFMTAVGVP